jgi:DNA-binding NtrC family response regulator
MKRVLAFTKEKESFERVEEMMKADGDIEIKIYSDALFFIEHLLSLHAEIAILDVDVLKKQTARMIQIIRLISPNLPVVLILSQENMAICLAVFSSGLGAYLIKPIIPENIRDLIISTLKINFK